MEPTIVFFTCYMLPMIKHSNTPKNNVKQELKIVMDICRTPWLHCFMAVESSTLILPLCRNSPLSWFSWGSWLSRNSSCWIPRICWSAREGSLCLCLSPVEVLSCKSLTVAGWNFANAILQNLKTQWPSPAKIAPCIFRTFIISFK